MSNITSQTNQIQLSTFNFHNSLVRTTEINGQIWFLANDVCSILEYKNTRRTISLHCKEKGVTKRYTPTSSGEQEMIYINEPNLFRLIIKSKKEEAVVFEEWVMEDLLPTIRKTGKYELPRILTPAHQRHIQNVVSRLANVAGNSYQAVYRSIKDRFQVGTYKDIPEEKYYALCEFLGCEPLEGEYIAFSNNKSNISDDEWYDLAWLFKAAYHMRDKLEDLSPSLNAIRSDYATSVSSMAHEYKRNLESAKVILIRETAHIEPYSFKWQTVLPELRNKF